MLIKHANVTTYYKGKKIRNYQRESYFPGRNSQMLTHLSKNKRKTSRKVNNTVVYELES